MWGVGGDIAGLLRASREGIGLRHPLICRKGGLWKWWVGGRGGWHRGLDGRRRGSLGGSGGLEFIQAFRVARESNGITVFPTLASVPVYRGAATFEVRHETAFRCAVGA